MIINKDFLGFVLLHAENKKNRIYFATVANGLCMALMMYGLSLGLTAYAETNEVSFRALAMFALALASFYYTQALGGKIVTSAVLEGLGALEISVMDKLRRTDYAVFNTMDAALIYAAVGGDKYGAVLASRFLIPTMAAMVVVALTGLYLCTVSLPGALLVAGSLYAVIRIRSLLVKHISARKKEDAAAADYFTVSLKDIVDGFNELKMNRQKSDALFAEKIRPASNTKNERLLGTELYQTRATVLEQATLFLPLGLTLFVLPLFFQVSTADLVKIISVTLIVIWPAYTLVQCGPISAAAADVIQRLRDLEQQLESSDLEPIIEKPEDYPSAPTFTTLNCKDLAYTYPKRQGDEKAFTLRVEEFHINKGELVIMGGGNGSGKSTFMRILAGLTQSTSGAISVDGKVLPELGQGNYRALFSIVMTDFRLFDKYYGNANLDASQLHKWLGKLGLISKVTDTDKLPVENLSSGQKKRMALLTAILENRQIMLLDEVAADFDPHFREKYYREILPELKAEGRTLFVISHDDRYYDIADRVLTMREGAISEQ